MEWVSICYPLSFMFMLPFFWLWPHGQIRALFGRPDLLLGVQGHKAATAYTLAPYVSTAAVCRPRMSIFCYLGKPQLQQTVASLVQSSMSISCDLHCRRYPAFAVLSHCCDGRVLQVVGHDNVVPTQWMKKFRKSRRFKCGKCRRNRR